MNTEPVHLYIRDNTGNLRVWSIQAHNWEVLITHGVLGGALQRQTESVPEGKGGRTREQQIRSRINSRISKQKDKGYVEDIDVARTKKATNALDLMKPMLAQPYKNGIIGAEYYVQMKYDGNRCLITKQGGEMIAYSRNGKLIHSIDHIIDAVSHIPEGAVLDGELYHHGTPLQTIRSWVSRKQAASNNLTYVCYDIMRKASYADRFMELQSFKFEEPVILAPSAFISNPKGFEFCISTALQSARENGYEGLILRCPTSHYEDGKRSKGLVKVKAWEDAEFPIVGMEKSADDWAVLVCRAPNDKLFKVTAPGTMIEKMEAWENPEKYIGKNVTVEYANLTKDGVPFHPVAVAYREPHE